jgi:Uma2 family endonuclease
MISTTKAPLIVEEYLSLGKEDVTYELIDGEAVAKMSPKFFHSQLTLAIAMLVEEWNNNQGIVGIEWAIRLQKNRRDWCPVPDLLYISYQRLGTLTLSDDACPTAPELVVEIISPEQSFSEDFPLPDAPNTGIKLRVLVAL